MKKNRRAITAKSAPARTLCKVLAASVLCFPPLVSTVLADVTVDISSRSGSTIIDISVSNGVRAERKSGRPGPSLSDGVLLPCRPWGKDRSTLECEMSRYYWSKGVGMTQGVDEFAPVAVARCMLPPDLESKLFMTPEEFFARKTGRKGRGFRHSETATSEPKEVSHYFTADATKEEANDYGRFNLPWMAPAWNRRGTWGPLEIVVPQQFSEESGVLKNFQLKYTIAGVDPADLGFIESTHTVQSEDCGKVTVSVQWPAGALVLAPGSEMKVKEKYWSENRQFYAIFQPDGNFGVYTKDDGYEYDIYTRLQVPLGAKRLYLERKGNLVFYGPDGEYIWGTDKIVSPVENSTLTASNSGALLLLAPDGAVLWDSSK
jgi:hypothetical protein